MLAPAVHPRLHPTAVIDPEAVLEDDVVVGPLSVVGAHVRIGSGTRLLGQCTVLGPTTLGARNVVYPFAVLGADPQHRSYAGELTRLVIGDDNVFREHVTVHRGTAQGGCLTTIGNRCLLMVGAHVAHDVHLADCVTLTNGTLLGGHVSVGAHAIAAGHVAVAPFARIGESAFLAGGAMVERDVPPFIIAAGDRAVVRALNRVGLQRRGIGDESLRGLGLAFRALFRADAPRAQLLDNLDPELASDPWVARLVDFFRAPTRLGVVASHRHRASSGS